MDKNIQRILLLDIDGTLMDSGNEGLICLSRAMEDVFGQKGPIESYSMSGKTDWQIISHLMGETGLAKEEIDASLPSVFTAYANHVEVAAPFIEMKLLPGVIELMEKITNNPNFILGLVTGNVRESVPHKLQAVGIDPSAFVFGAFGDDHIDRNQLPSLALHRLEQQLGTSVPPETVLVIGDTPFDIDCARHTGLKVLGVATGDYSTQELASHKPDFLLDDLSDTNAVMDILCNY